jgi:small subunit ribosomal protein S6
MRQYELVCIIQPDLEENAVNEVLERIKAWIAEASGAIEKIDLWGKRKLAYPIRKQKEGLYVLVNFSLEPAACATLERNLRFLEPVIRFSMVLN